ncbi:hypothetical protein HOA55_02435 [archaeon]|jgi:hypothetical protein|nr:hypothetical protein [archaeon]MBT3577836.1 hypothetical protein [archaeon]MBT6820187.1 hypothetical protein [archaeon]MBT6955782.1 hypothetical protein [archaeon]MBT7025298.1 hypothetical protein [archaeon]
MKKVGVFVLLLVLFLVLSGGFVSAEDSSDPSATKKGYSLVYFGRQLSCKWAPPWDWVAAVNGAEVVDKSNFAVNYNTGAYGLSMKYSTSEGNWLPANTYTEALRLNVDADNKIYCAKGPTPMLKVIYRVWGSTKVEVKTHVKAEATGAPGTLMNKINRNDTFQRQGDTKILVNGEAKTIANGAFWNVKTASWNPADHGYGNAYLRVTNKRNDYFDIEIFVQEQDEQRDSSRVWIDSYIESIEVAFCGDGNVDLGENCTSCPEDFSGVAETCDGIDNDCDGSIDNHPLCVTGQVCSQPGMVGYWGFDETSGIGTFDSSGSGDNGIGRRMTTINRTVGRVNGTLRLDGVDDYFEISDDDDSLALEKFTLASWFKVDRLLNAGETRVIFNRGESEENGRLNYGMGLMDNSGFLGSSGTHIQCAFETFEDREVRLYYKLDNSYVDRWVHAACALDETDWKMYVDGEEVNAGLRAYSYGSKSMVPIDSHAGHVPNASASSSYIGAAFSSSADGSAMNEVMYFFDGSLDEVSVWNKALTAPEVKDLYDKGLAGSGYCGSPITVGWADANFDLLPDEEWVDLGDSVRLVVSGLASGSNSNYEIWEVDGGLFYFDSEVTDISGVDAFWKANVSSDSGYYFKVFVDGELVGVSDILKVDDTSDDAPMTLKIENPLCGDDLTLGDDTGIYVEILDEDDIIDAVLNVNGSVTELMNADDFVSYTFDEAGNIPISLTGTNSRGRIKRQFSNVMVVDKTIYGTYIAACIDKPADFADVTERQIEFEAYGTRAIEFDPIVGKIVELTTLNDKSALMFNWVFSDIDQNTGTFRVRNIVGSNPRAYDFTREYFRSGNNWATLEVNFI